MEIHVLVYMNNKNLVHKDIRNKLILSSTK